MNRAGLSVLISWGLLSLMACESPAEQMLENQPVPGTIQLVYKGVSTEESVTAANFTLHNDSTGTIHYFAYDENNLHYSSEVLSDTGWAYLFWNFCGTGAEYLPLEPTQEVSFRTSLPPNSCTWRLLVNISDDSQEWGQLRRSAPIEFVKP
jgi:hypothetical protein